MPCQVSVPPQLPSDPIAADQTPKDHDFAYDGQKLDGSIFGTKESGWTHVGGQKPNHDRRPIGRERKHLRLPKCKETLRNDRWGAHAPATSDLQIEQKGGMYTRASL